MRVNEFNALGQFIQTWGWDVVQSGPGDDTLAPEDQFEICIPRTGDTCKEGIPGAGDGQLSAPEGVAVDSSGSVYVVDFLNHRVEKFDGKGNFLLAFGSSGTGPGQFGAWAVGSFIAIDKNGTPVDTDDKVYLGDVGRIQRFNTEGVFQGDVALPGKNVQSLATDTSGNLYYIDNNQPGIREIGPAGTELQTFELPQFDFNKPAPTAVAVDDAGNVYAFGPVSCCGSQDNVNPIFEFDPEGNLVTEFGKGEFSGSTGLATNLCAGSEAPGNLYVTNVSDTKAFLRAYGSEPIGCFKARTLPASEVEETSATLNGTVNPSGLAVSECFFELGTSTSYGQSFECDPEASELGTGIESVPVKAELSGLQAGTTYHFRLIANVGGDLETGADEEFKTKGSPIISKDHAVSVNDAEATLKAMVNPEGLQTSCQFEYGTSTAYGQTTSAQAIGKDRDDHPVVATLKGLAAGTTYHWRILCANESGTGEGNDRTFTTYFPAGGGGACANAAFRTDASAFLPDCRAYEMVSPVDKNGGDIVTEMSNPGRPGGYIQARADGNVLTYTAVAAFQGVQNSFRFNQYLAKRTERGEPGEGWASEGIHPPVAGQSVDPVFSFGLFREFMAFTPDLCSAWLIDYQTPPLTSDGQEGYANLYRRENCGPAAGGAEALTTVVPAPGTAPLYVEEDIGVQGVSDDGQHAIFIADAQLGPEARPDDPSSLDTQIYDRFGGELHLVSVLPDKGPGDPAAGDGKGFAAPLVSEVGSGSQNNLATAVTGDGARVYWSTSGGLYLREHPEQGIVAGECEAAGAPCTIRINGEGSAFFWAASKDGAKALYSEGEKLFEFDLGRFEADDPANPARRLIAEGVKGVAGASEDLARIYFVSTQAQAGAGENSEGDEAVVDAPNLYLAEGTARRFVATLATADVPPPGTSLLAYNLASRAPYQRATRVTPDGTRIAFESRAPLTGYDNSDTEDGRPTVEVFSYEAGGALNCISCNPSRALPHSAELREPYHASFEFQNQTNVPAAAWIPTWERQLHPSNVLSADGKRLFFNSNDALMPRDSNGAQDVYEWEAVGTGSCKVGDTNHFSENGGCLYLISSGESSYESEFWEASRDGRDVFFTTESSLLPQDPGSIDLYDARVQGGFPQPAQKAECEGEACQSPPPPPQFATPASGAYQGPHSRTPGKRPCPKGRHRVKKKGKARCVKNHKGKKRHHRASHNRRAPR